jgi:hypothetical protein
MLLGKEQGGTTVHGHRWENDGDEVEVPYELAMELLAIKGAGFYVPEAPEGEPGTPPKPQRKNKAGTEETGPAE